MAGYIGAKVGTVTANAADIKGDISATDTTPEIVLKNTSEEDIDGGREGTVTFKGERSGGEEVTLAQIEGSHHSTNDDNRGQLVFKTNNNQLGDNVTEAKMTIDSVGDVNVTSGAPSLTITNTTHEDTDGGRESKLKFQGEQSGGELSTLAQIEASHDGTADDEKGDLIFRTNDGSDGASPTERVRIDSNGSILTATLGTDNVHLGEGAGASIASGGDNNVLIGKEAGTAITTGDRNVAIGHQALKTEDADARNVAIGYQALTNQNAGATGHNVAVGDSAAQALTTGVQNTAVGSASLQNYTTGTGTTAIGYGAGTNATSTDHSTLIGYEAGGSAAMTGHDNTYIGMRAGKNTTAGEKNVAIGREALENDDVGSGCVAVGNHSLELQNAAGSTANGYYNTAVGYGASMESTTGYYNTCIGAFSGDDLTTGSFNVFVGNDATSNSGSDGNQICLGYNVDSVGGNYTTLGNNSIGRIYNQFSANASWTRTSDERIKKDIQTNTDCGLDFINDLRTVTYKWKAPSEHPQEFKSYDANITEAAHTEKMYGFIAQEVKAAMDTHNITGFNGWHVTSENQGSQQGVSYEMFVMPLVKAVQELSAKVTTLETKVAALEAE